MNDPLNDLFTLLPELLLLATVLVVIVTDLFLPRDAKWILTPLMLFGLVLTGIGCVLVWGVNETVFDGFYVVDDLSVFFKVATVVIGFMAALFAPSYLVSRRLPLGEFNAILGFSLLGMFVLASSSDLITLFLGLELMVMPAYLLTGFHKTDRFSNEGGLKYFLLGSFASAILLFGISWTYGLTGTTRISEIGPALGQAGDLLPAALVAIALLTVGATFKAAAVPFHYWTPDAYQGAPTPITGFLSVGPKLGAFALLVRLFAEGLAPQRADWVTVIAILAVLTMTVGNVVALTQTNVKRMLAYSSIAHTGYILAGLAAFGAATTPEAQQDGIEAILFYVLGYGIMNLAAFAVVGMLQHDPGSLRRPEQLRRPGRARARHRRGHGRADAVADRHPAHRRLLRQAVRAAGHHQRQPGLAGGRHRVERRAGRLLLPARDRLHVHARSRGRPGPHRSPPVREHGAGAVGGGRGAAGHLPGADPGPAAGVRRRALLSS